MAQNVAAIFFEPVFRSYGGEGPVEALRLSNEELKRQLAPQGGRTQVIFSMFVFCPKTPTKMVQINSSCGFFGLLNIYSCRFGFGGHPVAARCENLVHDLRNQWVRNQALPEIRNEIL